MVLESKDLIIEGQIAVWDLEITEKAKKVTERNICDNCINWKDPCVTKKENDLCIAHSKI